MNHQNFRDLLQVLCDGGVQFILIGGLAGMAHGSARATLDIDVVYERTVSNYDKITKSLAPYSPYLRGVPAGLPFKLDVDTLARGLNFTLTTTIGDIDFLGEVAGGGTYDKLINESEAIRIFGLEIQTVKLETLIDLKRAAGRPKDLEAIAELELLLEEEN
ncbi:nucleotidyltransferase [Pirellulaceae bacterium SH501]